MSANKIWIQNTQILTMTGAPLYTGDILIENDIIKALGTVNAQDAEGAQIIDGRRTVAMPGLVNTHTHAAMTLLRSYADDMELMPWLNDKIWPAEAKFVNEYIYWGSALAAVEMIQSGTTTFADMYDSMHEVAKVTEESGLRAILNYGHTFAHPVETLSSYRISHGEAVSIGMECAGLLALELGMWSKEQYLRQAALLDALHLPRRLPENTDIDSVIELMKSDKKNRNGKITFVLPVSTGSVKVVSDIPVELIRKVISEN